MREKLKMLYLKEYDNYFRVQMSVFLCFSFHITFCVLYIILKCRETGWKKKGEYFIYTQSIKKGRNKRKVIEIYGKEIIQKIFFFIKD